MDTKLSIYETRRIRGVKKKSKLLVVDLRTYGGAGSSWFYRRGGSLMRRMERTEKRKLS